MRSIEGKNVLVTGGAGFIGSHLCDELIARGAKKVVCVDNFFLGKMENIAEAMEHENFYINDLNYIASNYGLSKWHDLSAWYLYKYCCHVQALPLISYSPASKCFK